MYLAERRDGTALRKLYVARKSNHHEGSGKHHGRVGGSIAVALILGWEALAALGADEASAPTQVV